ncbi:hypothetical protein AB3S75_033497 [Citrus x aurantiifolia]
MEPRTRVETQIAHFAARQEGYKHVTLNLIPQPHCHCSKRSELFGTNGLLFPSLQVRYRSRVKTVRKTLDQFGRTYVVRQR